MPDGLMRVQAFQILVEDYFSNLEEETDVQKSEHGFRHVGKELWAYALKEGQYNKIMEALQLQ